MRNKGFFWFLTITLVVVCVYQLSFTWVTNSVETKAEKEALIRVDELKVEAKKTNGIALLPNGTEVDFAKPEAEELAKAAFINQILKEKANSKVYPVLGSTFQDTKSKSLAFGLDLVGGMSVTLEISVPELVKSFARNPRDSKFKKPYESALSIHNSKGGDFIDLFDKEFKRFNGNTLIVRSLAISEIDELDKNSTNSDVIAFFKRKVASSMDGVEQIMEKRINQFGVAEPNIERDPSSNRLYIELPGVQDEATVGERLQSTANLQFFETYQLEEITAQISQANALSRQAEIVQEIDTTTVTDSLALAKLDSAKKTEVKPMTLKTSEKGLADYLKQGGAVVIGNVKMEDREKVSRILAREDIKALFPDDLKFMWSAEPEKIAQNSKEEAYNLFAVKVPDNGKAMVGGKDIKVASKGLDQSSGAITVDLTMTSDGADRWAEMTTQNAGKFVAITMDDVVYSAPRVNEPITGGNTQISGSFSIQEAQDLAGLLNGGALPAPCVIKEQTKVGPSIGAENSSAGLISFGFAFLAVFIYMFFYYGKGGLVANIALAINVIFIFGCLASFGAVLTLAGIAGIVLTIGTAVDANILIFERIREEKAHGLDQKSAIAIGFSKALPSIIDANVTHLLVAIILKVFGTGPIESFATTLIIGIFTSMFSAIIISKLIITSWVEKGKEVGFDTTMSKNLFKKFNFDWVGKRKYFYIFSILITIGGAVSLYSRGLNPSVEFSGGRTFAVKFDKSADIELIRNELGKVFVENGEKASIDLKTKSNSYTVEISTNYKLSDHSATKVVNEKLAEGLAKCESKLGGFDVLESRSVSASVSQELISSSTIAIILSLIAIFAYIFIRFGNWQYSLGAIVGLAHDVMVVLSVFSILHGYLDFNMDVDQAFIAAILTVIGYSMNDTVIVFDRIRENLKMRVGGDSHAKVINSALNTTLSRTVNTSMILFVVILIMFIFGGPAIKGFLFAMLIGVIIGTYSSLCVATPILIDFSKKLKS
ncbi:MAG: protein translocase subunit SecD [Bacteroidota bacterium]